MQQYAQVSIFLSVISILLRLGLVDGILWILGILHGAGILMPSASIGLVVVISLLIHDLYFKDYER